MRVSVLSHDNSPNKNMRKNHTPLMGYDFPIGLNKVRPGKTKFMIPGAPIDH